MSCCRAATCCRAMSYDSYELRLLSCSLRFKEGGGQGTHTHTDPHTHTQEHAALTSESATSCASCRTASTTRVAASMLERAAETPADRRHARHVFRLCSERLSVYSAHMQNEWRRKVRGIASLLVCVVVLQVLQSLNYLMRARLNYCLISRALSSKLFQFLSLY
jgi:hypothetical protein